MDSGYHRRRFAVSLSVICLWLAAAVAAYWPWSALALGAVTIPAGGVMYNHAADYPTEPGPAIRIPASIRRPRRLTSPAAVIAVLVVLTAAVGIALFIAVQARDTAGTLAAQDKQLQGQ